MKQPDTFSYWMMLVQGEQNGGGGAAISTPMAKWPSLTQIILSLTKCVKSSALADKDTDWNVYEVLC